MTNVLHADFAKKARAEFRKPFRPTVAEPLPDTGIALTGFFASDLKFNSRSGMAQITFEIPWEFRHLAQRLLEHCDWPVNVYIEPQAHDDDFDDV